ncbi:MAG: ATP synthase F1 subunit gamma [Clostridiales bacterium]|nr:ATP synthase F1 subunit gamma [Clostridiales bacterium]
MAKDIKSLRTRIKSFDSTLHLTGAMGLVASSKIKRACDAMYASRKYSDGISDVTMALAACPECRKSPYFGLEKKDLENTEEETVSADNNESARTRLIVIAGDRGLCGGYNANVFRTVRTMEAFEIKPIGKRSYDKYHIVDIEGEDEETDADETGYLSSERYTYEDALEEAETCCKDFLEGKIDRVLVVYNRYISIMSQEPQVIQLLPLERASVIKDLGSICEPAPDVIFEDLIPVYFAAKLYALVKESFACEVAARRMAMDSAKKNAQQMIDDLKLEYNRARQSTITQEITEIVSGAGK